MMETMYRYYLKAFWSSMIVNPIGEHQFSVPSNTKEGVFHFIHYDGTGHPKCNCEAARYGHPCAHQAAVMAYCSPPLQRQWDEKRIREFNESRLKIINGTVNPRRNRRIRAEMDRIQAELDAKFNTELDQQDSDERMRLKLGMGGGLNGKSR